MKPVKDLVDLVVLALTQTTDGGRLEVVSARTASFVAVRLNLFHEG